LDKNHFREWRKVGTLLKKLRWSWSSLCIDFVSCENLYFGYIELSESFGLFLCPYVFCVIKNGTTSPGVEYDRCMFFGVWHAEPFA
jgi:hypothetical protein